MGLRGTLLRLAFACLSAGVGVGVRMTAMGGPRYVLEGHNLTLTCDFDLEGNDLYSLLWWHDGSVLLRYTVLHPGMGGENGSSETPLVVDPITNVTTHPLAWFTSPTLHAHLGVAGGPEELVLSEVGPESSGVYSCEVTTEAPPTFLTANTSVTVHVVVPPVGYPLLQGTTSEVRAGQWVAARCDSAPALPAPNLTFYINDRQVVPGFMTDARVRNTSEHLLVVSRSLGFTAYSQLFIRGHLVLECRVELERLVWRTTTVLKLEGYRAGAAGHVMVGKCPAATAVLLVLAGWLYSGLSTW